MQLSAIQTLADPCRFQIVETLLSGEQAVNDIVDKMDIHQSGVSRHLRILEEAGFVRMRPDGQRRLYSLRPEPFRELEAWARQYRALWEGRLDAFAEALERRQHARALDRPKLDRRSQVSGRASEPGGRGLPRPPGTRQRRRRRNR